MWRRESGCKGTPVNDLADDAAFRQDKHIAQREPQDSPRSSASKTGLNPIVVRDVGGAPVVADHPSNERLAAKCPNDNVFRTLYVMIHGDTIGDFCSTTKYCPSEY